jgi:hypothetical protein
MFLFCVSPLRLCPAVLAAARRGRTAHCRAHSAPGTKGELHLLIPFSLSTWSRINMAFTSCQRLPAAPCPCPRCAHSTPRLPSNRAARFDVADRIEVLVCAPIDALSGSARYVPAGQSLLRCAPHGPSGAQRGCPHTCRAIVHSRRSVMLRELQHRCDQPAALLRAAPVWPCSSKTRSQNTSTTPARPCVFSCTMRRKRRDGMDTTMLLLYTGSSSTDQ